MTAAVLFALAAALSVGPSPGSALGRLTPPPKVRGQRRPVRMVVLACIGVGLVTVLLGVRVGGWVAAFAVVATTALWLVRGARDDRRRIRRKAAVARAARTLALLLQAGQVPAAALEDAASDCPVLAPAALTGRLGGDVAAALRESGRQPGGEGLMRVSAAWRVSERTGAPVADVLSRVAENLRKERHLASVVAAELASARASGRIMAMLPFVAVAVGSIVGANPIAFLFGSSLGEVVFIAGTLLAAAGVVWTERIARSGLHGGGRR